MNEIIRKDVQVHSFSVKCTCYGTFTARRVYRNIGRKSTGTLPIRLPIQITTRRDDFLRQVSTQLEKLEYRKLYRAYSGKIRKSQVEPKIMFKLLVCAYAKGIYTSRRIEELCRENIPFILMLDGHRAPDHCAIARFRSGKRTQEAIEGLF